MDVLISFQESAGIAPSALSISGEAGAVQAAQETATSHKQTSGGSGGGGGSGGERNTRRFSFAQSFLRMASHDTRGSSSSSHQLGTDPPPGQGSSSQSTADGVSGGNFCKNLEVELKVW